MSVKCCPKFCEPLLIKYWIGEESWAPHFIASLVRGVHGIQSWDQLVKLGSSQATESLKLCWVVSVWRLRELFDIGNNPHTFGVRSRTETVRGDRFVWEFVAISQQRNMMASPSGTSSWTASSRATTCSLEWYKTETEPARINTLNHLPAFCNFMALAYQKWAPIFSMKTLPSPINKTGWAHKSPKLSNCIIFSWLSLERCFVVCQYLPTSFQTSSKLCPRPQSLHCQHHMAAFRAATYWFPEWASLWKSCCLLTV